MTIDLQNKDGLSQFTTTRDGIKLSYAIHTSKKPTNKKIVLIHSLAMDKNFWLPVANQLTEIADVLTYDCRGHGVSDKPNGPYSADQFADDFKDIIDMLGWKKIIVAGASMGGSIALNFSIRHAASTSGLGLVDTTASYGDDAPKNWAERAAKTKKDGMQALIDFQKTRWFSDGFRENNPDIVQQCIDCFCKNDVEAFSHTCNMMGSFDLRSELDHIKCPVEIIVGEEDYATPVAMSKFLNDSIANSKMTIIKGARHLTPLESTGKVSELLSGLADRT